MPYASKKWAAQNRPVDGQIFVQRSRDTSDISFYPRAQQVSLKCSKTQAAKLTIVHHLLVLRRIRICIPTNQISIVLCFPLPREIIRTGCARTKLSSQIRNSTDELLPLPTMQHVQQNYSTWVVTQCEKSREKFGRN